MLDRASWSWLVQRTCHDETWAWWRACEWEGGSGQEGKGRKVEALVLAVVMTRP